jgi:SAM-dependent methyltransferase
MRATVCCVCDTAMQPLMSSWSFCCPQCGTWGSSLHVGINGPQHHVLDEDLRETGLSLLRKQNNEIILDRLRMLNLAPGGTLLDVGAAHGWFVLAALDRGLKATGIDPDVQMAERADANGADIRRGYFPDALDADDSFDAICFNDVLEHIVDVRAAVAACDRHLRPGGLLSINIPNSRGLLYRVALLAKRAGAAGLFDRLWQVSFPSPHVWYFDEAGLSALCASQGLPTVFTGRLPTLTRAGLWQRTHLDRRRPSLASVAGVAAAWVATPMLNSTWATDIMHVIARKPRA